MFSSFFTTVDPNAANFHPVTDEFKPEEQFGELEPTDLEWTCASGFVAETQCWYHHLENGQCLMFQIIHSSVGMWYPTVQFTCKLWDPETKDKTWKSLNVSNFVTPPPNTSSKSYDKRSAKADEFTVIHSASPSPEYAESYTVNANLGQDLQLSVVVARPVGISGFKMGKGPKGGFSYFGPNKETPEGYVVHRFWPRTHISGHIIHKGQAIEAKGTGMFVHAIQGMRPNLVAASWNFAEFQSDEYNGTSAVQMEFKTIDAYGGKGAGSGGVLVNVGAIIIGGKLVAVTGETNWPGETPSASGPISRVEHIDAAVDPDTGYAKPTKIQYTWSGSSAIASTPGTVEASLSVDLGSVAEPKGLIEKVDVLAEIPYVIKAFVNYVAGTKPYIYQWLNPASLTVKAPAALIDGSGEGDKTVTISGLVFNEASFIS